jgi:hypothetical protein
MNFNSANPEPFTHQDSRHRGANAFHHGMYDSQSHPEPVQVMRNNFNNSTSRTDGYSKVSSGSAPHPHSGPYSSVLNSSTNHLENMGRSMGSSLYSAERSEGSIAFPFVNQLGQFNEHQGHVSPLNKTQVPSNSHTNNELQIGRGTNYVDSRRSWTGSGKNPANQNVDYKSYPSQQVNLSKNPRQFQQGIYSEQPSGEISWPSRSKNTERDTVCNTSVQLSDKQAGNTFSSNAPMSQPYLDHSRNTYSSAYNRLKQGDTQHIPASSHSGPTFSQKPTYSGVYTKVRR